MPRMTRERLYGLLGTELTQFVSYLLQDAQTDPDSPIDCFIFKNMESWNHHDPLFVSKMDSLVTKGVISQSTRDYILNH